MSDYRFGVDDYGLNIYPSEAFDGMGSFDIDKVERIEIEWVGFVRERTCEPNWVLQGETQTQEFWRCECGNCGECFGVEDRESFPFKITIDKVDIPNFCPNCGAKVAR